MNDELMHFYLRNMAQLHKETFQDKYGKTVKVLASTERQRVLLQYLNHANSDHLAFPGVNRLAQETGLDPKNVRAARADLVRAGWLIPAGSRNYAGITSQKLPGTARPGRKSAVSQFLVMMPGMADELPLQGGVLRGVTGGVTGGVTNTPQTETETKTPVTSSANTPGQRPKARGAKKENQGAETALVEELVKRDLEKHPPREPAGYGLKNRKAQEFQPLVERALALPGAARYPGAVLRVVEAWHGDERPDQHDLAALEGRELRHFSHEDLPPVEVQTLDQVPPNVQEMVAAYRKGRPAGS